MVPAPRSLLDARLAGAGSRVRFTRDADRQPLTRVSKQFNPTISLTVAHMREITQFRPIPSE